MSVSVKDRYDALEDGEGIVSWRSPEERYGIYRRKGDDLSLIATTPTAEGVGVAIMTLGLEGEFENASVGVLDSGGDPRNTGRWVVNPWS